MSQITTPMLPTSLGGQERSVRILPDKSALTTIVSAAVTAAGLLIEGPAGDAVFTFGMFALSGAVTNWIAVHMLFEKIPGLYGSGVVQARFEEIRSEIRDLILDQFFDEAHVRRVLEDLGSTGGGIDFDDAWERVKGVVLNSNLGGMLGMIGGASALEPLKEPFIEQAKGFVSGATSDGDTTHEVRAQIASIIDERVAELTPAQVKAIVQRMIKDYLGWLVVWGGVFGGSIGLAAWAVQTFIV
ncbi:MAG: DUF445 domain-containing protein [Planctomycetota bacterium]